MLQRKVNTQNIFIIESIDMMKYFQPMVIYYDQLLVSGDIAIAMATTCYVLAIATCMAMAIAIRI